MTILYNTTTSARRRFRTPVPQFLRDHAKEANANLAALVAAQARGEDTLDWYRDLFASAEMVFLMYRDDAEDCGLGLIVAKGRPLMKRAIDAGNGLTTSTVSMIAADKAQACALWAKFGNGFPAVRS